VADWRDAILALFIYIACTKRILVSIAPDPRRGERGGEGGEGEGNGDRKGEGRGWHIVGEGK
jgi:hypothetical protein